jgi:hypothetical protein
MAMPRRAKPTLTDHEIKQLWSDYYRHRKYDPWARVICELIRVIVNDRARGRKTIKHWRDDFDRARAHFSISKQQWDEF